MSTPQPPSMPANPDPWSYPSEGSLPAPSPDVLASPAEAAFDGRRRRRSPFIFVAAALVVALMLGGGAYAGMRLWNGSGAQPEDATPSTAAAFVRLDLSPGYGQRLKVNNLLKKFPGKSGKDAINELKQGIFEALDVDEASYRKNVEPWFADRVGVALWSDATKRPYGLIVLAVDDEKAARTGLTELQRKDGAEKFGFGVRDGYALVAKGDKAAQAAADAAGKDAQQESLSDSADFRSDVDRLPARQTALAWGDLSKVGAALQDSFGDMLNGLGGKGMPSASTMLGGAFLAPGMKGMTSLADLNGRMVIGAQATDNGVEIRFRATGAGTQAPAGAADTRSTVDSLPANSAIAASTRVGDVGTALNAMIPHPDMAIPEDVLKQMPKDQAAEMRKEMEKTSKQFETVEKALSAVSGAKISFAITKLDGSVPGLVASAEASSADKAATLAEALKLAGDEVTVTTSGSKVELKTKTYAADGGTLGDQALYREALDGAPENASAVVYLDMQRLLASGGDAKDREQVKALKAIGLAAGTEDDDVVGLLRVVIK